MKRHTVSAIMSFHNSFQSELFIYRWGNWGPKWGSKLLKITNGVSNRSRTWMLMPESEFFPYLTKTPIKRKKKNSKKYLNKYWEVKSDHRVFWQCGKCFLDHLWEMTIIKKPTQYHKEQAHLEWLGLSKCAVQQAKKNGAIR